MGEKAYPRNEDFHLGADGILSVCEPGGDSRD